MSGEERTTWSQLHRVWLGPILILASATTLVLALSLAWDYLHRPAHLAGLGPLELLLNYDAETLQNALGNLAQTVAAVLGIVITVVAIVVQLAATRYTPRVTELFFREKTNFVVLGFFVVSCVVAIWVSLSVGNGFLPQAAVVVSVMSVTLSLFLMVPYFVYVFDFLDPEHVVGHIQRQAFRATRSAAQADMARGQEQMLAAIEQLADIAVTATAQKDRIISARAVEALRALVVRYTRAKAELPESWFQLGPALAGNPDFQSMNAEAREDLVRDRLWVEWKLLRQYQTIYNEALQDNPDMNYLIAINTRYLGEAILEGGAGPALGLVIKFFNTYLRSTLNKRQVRTTYNILNQYRQLVEAALAGGQTKRVEEIAGYFRYYGQVANGLGLGFVTETVAYDLATLCEHAHRRSSPGHDVLLGALLELDKEAEDEAQEETLRGVRKAQARLATFYLQRGDEPLARRIFEDMRPERPERLVSIRDELLRIESKDFWEVIDRGANFDYLEPARKELLERYFSWFPNVPPPSSRHRRPEVTTPTRRGPSSERLQQADAS